MISQPTRTPVCLAPSPRRQKAPTGRSQVGRGLLQRGTPHAKWQFLEAKHSTTGGPLVTNIRNPRLNGERGPAKIIFNSVSDHFQTLAKMIAD
jgi:hypothetical protein